MSSPHQADQVFWGQGAFLAPQHLQAQDAFHQASLQHRLGLLLPYHHGFEALQWSAEALESGIADIQHFSLLTQGGQWVRGGSRQQGERGNAQVPQRGLLELPVTDKEPIALYLALTQSDALEGLAPTRSSSPGTHADNALPARHTLHDTVLADPYDPQAPQAEIAYLHYQARILTSLDEHAQALLQSCEAYCFAEIVPDGPGRFRPSPSYIPPSLRIDASDNLLRWSHALYDLLLSRGQDFAALKRQRGIRSASTSAQEVMRALMMQTFARHLPRLQEHLRPGLCSPWQLYQQLRELVAEFSVFSEDTGYFGAIRAANAQALQDDAHSELPDYDHQDLQRCFRIAFDRAARLVKALTVGAEVGITLAFDGRFHKAELPETLFKSDRTRYYLAFEGDVGGSLLSEQLQRTGKIASLEDMPRLLQAALFGLKIDLLAVPPEELPQKTPNTTYFLVDTRNPFWQFIRERRNIAVFTGAEVGDTVIKLYPVDSAQ